MKAEQLATLVIVYSVAEVADHNQYQGTTAARPVGVNLHWSDTHISQPANHAEQFSGKAMWATAWAPC